MFTCIFTSSRPATKSLLNPNRCLTSACCRQDENPFPLVPQVRRSFGATGLFKDVFDDSSLSSMTCWPKTSAKAWVTPRSAGRFRRLYVCCFCFFYSSLSLSISLWKLASRSLYNLDLPHDFIYIYLYIYKEREREREFVRERERERERERGLNEFVQPACIDDHNDDETGLSLDFQIAYCFFIMTKFV